jgi:hypothetical protein
MYWYGTELRSTNMGRIYQLILIASTLCLCWLGMLIVHELGHVLLAWASGETIHGVVLHPLAISRTDTSHEKHPLRVIWGGPVLGTLVPLGAWLLAQRLRLGIGYLVRFFAGFCLVANGAYVGVGACVAVGDPGDLARFGCPRWVMVLFGLVCVPIGLFLWHGLGPYFGLKEARGQVDRRAALGTLALALILVAAELIADGR